MAHILPLGDSPHGPDAGRREDAGRRAWPWCVLAAMAVLLCLQLTVIAGLRGVADPQGYGLNTSKKFQLNIFEDDGILSLAVALGYNKVHEDRFSYLFGIGGPVLHLARPVMAGLGAMGLVVRFDAPDLYQLYPQELERCYKAYAVYQLLAFTLWLPAAGYLLLSRHVSRRAGCWGAWLLALTPFLSAFETRIKPDSAALLFGLLALHFALAHLESGRRRQLLAAWALLGFSFAIKLTCAPLAGILLWLLLARSRLAGEPVLRPLAQAAATCLFVFLAANPLFLYGFGNIAVWLSGYWNTMHAPAGTAGQPSTDLGEIGRNLLDLRVYFGPVLGRLFVPLLAGLTGRLLWRLLWRRLAPDAVSVLTATCLLQLVYIVVVGGQATVQMTYYYYTTATFGLLLAACCLDGLGAFPAARHLRRLWRAALLPLVLAPLAATNLQVVNFVTTPTNRQLAHAWLEANLPEGVSIGARLPADGPPVNQFVRLDPFRYQTEALGPGLDRLEERKPAYLLLEARDYRSDAPPPGYDPLAVFARGEELPRRRLGTFQDEAFAVFKRRDAPAPAAGPALWEQALGRLARQDPEPGFALLQYQALRFFPISVNLFRKQAGTLVPGSSRAFLSSLRHGSSPVAYLHHIGPTAMTLWGVKYLWARLDGSFAENVLGGGYALRPVALPGLAAKDHPDLGAFRFDGYQGQAVFAPDAPWTERRAETRWLRPRPLPGAGVLLPAEALGGAQAIEVRLEIEADGPADVVLKGGPRRRSFVVGPGRNTLLVPYEAGETGAAVEYEVNPVTAGVAVRLLAVAARPLPLAAVGQASAAPREAFASVTAPAPGRVFFALPWHGHWLADVDGQAVRPQPGPAGVVAVPVAAGEHFVSLYFRR